MARLRARRSSRRKSRDDQLDWLRRRGDYLPYVFAIIIALAIIGIFYGSGIGTGAAIGKKITSNYQQYCTENIDPNNNYYIKGQAVFGNKVYSDYCQGDILYQWDCHPSVSPQLTRPYECPNGCSNGACKR